MSKKPRHKTTGSAPQPDQLTAIRRIADTGDLDRARQCLAALRKAFPGFKPLLGLAWEIESLAGEPINASARAWDWQLASPNSAQALEALADSAREAGLLALMARALQRLSRFDEVPAAPLPPDAFDTPLGPLTFEQAQAIDLSRVHLAAARKAGVETLVTLDVRDFQALLRPGDPTVKAP